MINNKNPNLLFVGGAPRSGTTLVQKILNSHPNIIARDELASTREFVKLFNHINRLYDSGKLNDYFGNGFSDLQRIFNSFLVDILLLNSDKKNVEYCSEKTPSNILAMPDILNAFPNSKFIIVLRDPRAIYFSMKKVKEEYRKDNNRQIPIYIRNVSNAAGFITKCYNIDNETLTKYSDRILIVKYEEIVTNTSKNIKKITDFLNIKHDTKMLNPEKHAYKEWSRGKSYWYNNELYNKPIEQRSLFTWKKKLSSYENFYLSKKCIRRAPLLNSYNEDSHISYLIQLKILIVYKIYTVRRFTKNLIYRYGYNIMTRI